MTALNRQDKLLVKTAQDLMKARRSKIASVASVLRTKDGRIFKGVCIDVSVGFCAEYTAVGTMVTEGSTAIDTIVAVYTGERDYPVLPPCGRCRQLLVEFGNPWVIVDKKRKFRLNELLPVPYRSGFGA